MRAWKGRRFGGNLLCGICVAAVMLPACDRKEAPEAPVRPARTMILKPSGALRVRTFPALIEPVDQVDLSFDVAGPLVKLPVEEGDLVKKGQLVAQIRLRDFEIAVRQADGNLKQAQAELKKMQTGARKENILRLEAAQRSARAVLDTTAKDLARMKSAFATKVATQRELDRSQESRDKAAEALRQAEEELNIGRAGARAEDIEAMVAQIETLMATLDRAKADRTDATLTAPFEGLITRKFVDNYQSVRAKERVVRLVAEEIEARVNVPEQDVLKRAGKKAKLSISIRDKTGQLHVYPAARKKWSPEADPETGTFAVYLSVKIPEAAKKSIQIVSGMSATARAEIPPDTEAAIRAHRVPLAAVFSPRQGQSCVWVVDPKTSTLARRDVRVGEQAKGEIWILEGVTDGEEILTAGAHYVREGQKISRIEPGKDG